MVDWRTSRYGTIPTYDAKLFNSQLRAKKKTKKVKKSWTESRTRSASTLVYPEIRVYLPRYPRPKNRGIKKNVDLDLSIISTVLPRVHIINIFLCISTHINYVRGVLPKPF